MMVWRMVMMTLVLAATVRDECCQLFAFAHQRSSATASIGAEETPPFFQDESLPDEERASPDGSDSGRNEQPSDDGDLSDDESERDLEEEPSTSLSFKMVPLASVAIRVHSEDSRVCTISFRGFCALKRLRT